MNLQLYHNHKGVYCNNSLQLSADFEQLYLQVRSKEGRVFADEELRLLPELPVYHTARQEWKIRKQSARNLLRSFRRQGVQHILEIGCGNGWLSNLFCSLPDTEVTAVDINLTELQQAAGVFNHPNLFFVYDVFTAAFMPEQQFDVIVFAASVQYFSSLHELLPAALQKLKPGGAIHITDTFFYDSAEAQEQAAARSEDYYTSLGFPAMSNYYFHHMLQELQGYNYQIKPASGRIRRFSKNSSPFPWIIITS